MTLIASWQTPKGKHWVQLFRYDDGAYGYRGNDCGGVMGVLASDEAAIAKMEESLPYMAPDNAKIGMQRVK